MNGSGLMGSSWYRKMHQVAVVGKDDLEGGVTPGGVTPVFACDFGKLGVQICWDIQFDDGWQALANAGAEIVAWPSATAISQPMVSFSFPEPR